MEIGSEESSKVLINEMCYSYLSVLSAKDRPSVSMEGMKAVLDFLWPYLCLHPEKEAESNSLKLLALLDKAAATLQEFRTFAVFDYGIPSNITIVEGVDDVIERAREAVAVWRNLSTGKNEGEVR